MTKTLWVKFGWSDYYRGGPVDGNFGWLNERVGGENEGRGHEAYNFIPAPDGIYYCSVPPHGRARAAPSNRDPNGWTVICLAKNPDNPGVHIVGWYRNAMLIGKRISSNPAATAAIGGNTFSYCITSKNAYFVPPKYRTVPFSHPSVGQGKFSYLEGPGVNPTNNKRQVLDLLTSRMRELTNAQQVIENPSEATIPDPVIDAADPLRGFGTAEQRRQVEQAAENAVIAHYRAKGFTDQRVTHLPCGYDFIFSNGLRTLHVEVKGTASNVPQFFLTRNEHAIGMMSNPAWRLAMVTCALTKTPKIDIYEADKLSKEFDLKPYVFLGKFIPKSEG